MSDEGCENCARLTAEVARLSVLDFDDPKPTSKFLGKRTLHKKLVAHARGLEHWKSRAAAAEARGTVEHTRYIMADAGWKEMNRQNEVLAARVQQMRAALQQIIGASVCDSTYFIAQGSGPEFSKAIWDARALLADPAGTAPPADPEKNRWCTHCGRDSWNAEPHEADCVAGQRAGEPTG